MALKISYPNGETATIQTGQMSKEQIQVMADKVADNWERNRSSEGEIAFEVVPDKPKAGPSPTSVRASVKGL